jgi:hypothetical protein
MKALEVGDNVLVPVPEFDRGRSDPANLIGVILNKTAGSFKVGTKAGILSGKFSRNQLEGIKFNGFTNRNVPDEEITIRTAVRTLSVGHGQGYKRCHCSSTCLTKRCSCMKAGIRCNSACHPKRSCKNID